MDRESQKAQVDVLLLATGAANTEIERALSVLSVRNRVTHEGYGPTPAEAEALREVVQTIKKLAEIDEIKSPVLTLSNRLSSPERQHLMSLDRNYRMPAYPVHGY